VEKGVIQGEIARKAPRRQHGQLNFGLHFRGEGRNEKSKSTVTSPILCAAAAEIAKGDGWEERRQTGREFSIIKKRRKMKRLDEVMSLRPTSKIDRAAQGVSGTDGWGERGIERPQEEEKRDIAKKFLLDQRRSPRFNSGVGKLRMKGEEKAHGREEGGRQHLKPEHTGFRGQKRKKNLQIQPRV